MAKSKTVRVASRAHTPLVLFEPHPDPEKPGNSPPLRSVTLAAHGQPGVESVSDVDAEVWHAWKKANPHHEWLSNGIVREVPADHEPQQEPEEFGFEAGLEAAAKDKDAKKAAKAGSAVKDEAPVSDEDMTPTSDTPPDDGYGEPRHASQPGEPEPATTRRRGRPASA